MTNNLNRTTVTATSNVHTAINDADGVMDAAITAVLTYTVDSTTETLSSAEFRGYTAFILTAGSPAPGGAVTLNVPAVSRGRFTVINDCGQTVTVQISGQSETAPTVADGFAETFICDGTDVRAATTGSGGAALYDIPLSYAGTPAAGELIGKVIAVRDIDFAADFAGSAGHVTTNPAATFDIDVQDDGVSIGTISISTGGVFTFATTSNTAKTVASGSRIEFYADASSPADASIAVIAATLKGTV